MKLNQYLFSLVHCVKTALLHYYQQFQPMELKEHWSPAVITTSAIGTTEYNFTPDAGQCAVPEKMIIKITDKIKPIFAQAGPFCKNSVAPLLPLVSTDGIKGTWNPGIITTSMAGVSAYKFTPDAGQCAVPVTIDITITDEIKPLFVQLGPLCQNSVAPLLPAVSTNGITGTWNPKIITTSLAGTSAYKFTPDAGQRAVAVTMDIKVTDEIKPIFVQLGPLCQNSVAPLLPAVSTNGITGTSNPAIITTSVAGTSAYQFTPAAGQCAVPVIMNIEITKEITPLFAAMSPLCPNGVAPLRFLRFQPTELPEPGIRQLFQQQNKEHLCLHSLPIRGSVP
ncbi:MAG: hypothetical protein MZV70_45925 [Desulfobacterales bacterium]|nr:hypothetical protein [Desulfobacterales bacterium]